MEYVKIKNQIKESMVKSINDVILENEKSIKIYFVRPNDILEYFTSLLPVGESVDTDTDTNGWQWDYWITIVHHNQEYIISGDGFYQDYLTIEKK